jgi:hypothetical protein
MKRLLASYACLPWFVLFGSGAANLLHGQGNRATINGTITDSSGGVVQGVAVTAKNLGTGEQTPSISNNDGIYSILNLFPGQYSLHFEKTGFKPIDIPSITLLSTQVAKFDEQLEIGATTQSVTVSTQAPILDTESATEGTHLTGQVVTDLPLNIYGGRQIETFALALTPGYSLLSSPYEAVINGTQGFTKDITLDGTTATAQIQGD